MSLDRIADIDPHKWAIVDGKLYLNNGGIAQSLWSLNKSGNIASGDRNWQQYPKNAEQVSMDAISDTFRRRAEAQPRKLMGAENLDALPNPHIWHDSRSLKVL